ncbi:MAG: hypothetical protein QGD88_02660 [Anaerolineae bacterium]|nr:hypothetical protein [Anaerolineae bacterium]
MDTLTFITFAVNFFALVAALWLGFYLVTRSPRALTAWLTAFTLWSLGGLFLNILLALNPPPSANYQPAWLRFLFPFFSSGTFEHRGQRLAARLVGGPGCGLLAPCHNADETRQNEFLALVPRDRRLYYWFGRYCIASFHSNSVFG